MKDIRFPVSKEQFHAQIPEQQQATIGEYDQRLAAAQQATNQKRIKNFEKQIKLYQPRFDTSSLHVQPAGDTQEQMLEAQKSTIANLQAKRDELENIKKHSCVML